jgi:O-antigen/teichoic acid export membrane protein
MPEAFAMIGIVASIMFVIQLISDVGFRSYLLRHSTEITAELVSNLWLLQAARGVLLTLLGLAVATPISNYVSLDGFDSAVRIACLMFVINGFTSLSPYLLEKQGLVTKPIMLEFLASVIGALAMLSITVAYKSVWCVIVGGLFSPILSLIFSYVFYDYSRVHLTFSRSLTRDFFDWAKYIIPSSIITIFCVQLDKFVLVKILSPELLGVYFIALNISMIGTQFLIQFSRKIVGPTLASNRISDQQEFSSTFYQAKHIVLILVAAGLGAFIASADVFVWLIYDDRYSAVGPLLSLLLLRAVFCLWTYPLEVFLVIKGQVKSTLVGNVLRAIWIVILLFPAYTFIGYTGVVFVFVSAEIPVALYFIYRVGTLRGLVIVKELTYVLCCVAAYGAVKSLIDVVR